MLTIARDLSLGTRTKAWMVGGVGVMVFFAGLRRKAWCTCAPSRTPTRNLSMRSLTTLFISFLGFVRT